MTSFFDQVLDAEREINSHFLNFKYRQNGNYTKRQLSHFDGYSVLVHGEIEAYFESCANQAIDLAESAIRSDRYNRIVYSLVAFHNATIQDREGESASKVPDGDIWSGKAHKAIRNHRDKVQGNHGVRTDNLCRLFIPIGVDVRKIDSVLLVELDQFGSARGATAHSSLAARRGTQTDPFIKKAEIRKIIELLKSFDEIFDAFIRDAQATSGEGPFKVQWSAEGELGG